MAKEQNGRSRQERADRKPKPADGVGGIVDEIASTRIFGDALTRIVDAGERVMHAQQSALSALGLPSGSQLESLTLRVRTVFHRIEELEDDLDRLERRISSLEASVRDAGAEPGRASERPRAKATAPAAGTKPGRTGKR